MSAPIFYPEKFRDDSMKGRQKALLVIALFASFFLTMAAYYPGLSGGFMFDDLTNIVDNKRLQIDSVNVDTIRQAAFSVDSGTLKRPIAMLTFWANYYAAGLDPFYFKLINVLIHVLNGALLFWLTVRLLSAYSERHKTSLSAVRTRWISLAVTAAWLFNPMNLTDVLYVVQRMNSLSATFTLAGLLCYVQGRERLDAGRRGFALIASGLVGFGLLAVLSKETGALLPMYMLAIEATIFGFRSPAPGVVRRVRLLFLIVVVLPALLVVGYLATHPDWITNQYRVRSFTLFERVLTEARVLWLYLGWILVPNLRQLGLFHDDIAVSHGLLHPATTVVAIVALACAIAAAFYWLRRAPLLSFAVIWYLVGHSIESSFIGLELVFEHRNYLPMYGPLLGLTYAVLRPSPAVALRARQVAVAGWIGLLACVTTLRASEWRTGDLMRMYQVEHHPNSARANFEAGYALGNRMLGNPLIQVLFYDKAKSYFEKAIQLDPNRFPPMFAMVLLNQSTGHQIDQHLLHKLATRLRDAPLNITVVGQFQSLNGWLEKGIVKLSKDQVVALYEQALGNPSASHATRALLLSQLSAYYANTAGDLQGAVATAIAATKEDPSQPVHHISLADLAIRLGNYHLAAAQLARASALDHLGRLTLRIAHFRKLLTQAKEGDGRGPLQRRVAKDTAEGPVR
jgi:tetratricopeptide (TPR) repeat protein